MSSDMYTPQGVTGLDYSHGEIYEEWDPQLQGPRWKKAVPKMLSDPLIAGILLAIEMLIRQVDWTVVAASDAPEDQEAADFIDEAMKSMRPTWIRTLPELLSFLPWGWAVLEQVYTRDSAGRTVWASWDIRAQESADGWEFDEFGRAMKLRQLPPSDFKRRTIELSRCIHVTTTSRKGNPEGRSIIRAAHRPWYFKTRIENIEGIGIERDLAGLPVAKVPARLLAANRTAEESAIYNAIRGIVTSIRRDEREGIIWPLEYDKQTGQELYKLELLSTGGRRQFDTSGIIGRYEARMAMSMLADFILLGHEKVGSFALSSDKTSLFGVALGAFLDTISDAVAEQAFRMLLELNGMRGAAPRLSHTDIETADLGELGAYLESLNKAGMVLFPNPDLESHLLKQAGLPVVGGEL